MPKHIEKAAPQRADTRGESVLLLPRCVTGSEQWKALGFRARYAVIAIASHFNGYNNGEIGVSTRQFAEAMGSRNLAGNEKALQEAILAGFVERTRDYPKARRLATEYRLTWVQTGKAPHFTPATHDYLQGEVVGNKRREQPCKSVSIIEAGMIRPSKQGKEQPVSTIEAGEAENATLPVSITEALISSTTPPTSSAEPSRSLETSRGLERPRSIPEDSWIIAQRRAAANPAGVGAEHVRAVARAYLHASPRGEQSRLCEAADIPVSTFSKFLNGGPLTADRLGRLMIELMKRGGGAFAQAA